MHFKYIAHQQDGKLVQDEMEAQDVPEVLGFLASRGLRPVTVNLVSKGLFHGGIPFFGQKINLNDKIFISRYLGLMLKMGTSLLEAINIMIGDLKKPSLRNFLIEVRSNLERGQPFYGAFAKHEREFGQVYINLIKAGEASGNLEKVFQGLAISLTKEKQLRDNIRGAMTYPLILLSSSVVILFVMMTFLIPKVAKVFLESGFDPPIFSKIVFSVSLFFGAFGQYIIVAYGVILAGGMILYGRSYLFRSLVTNGFKSVPLIRGVVKKIALQRFAGTLSSLIRAGIPLIDCLEITADVVGHRELKRAIVRVNRDGLTKGLSLGDAFKREPFMPQTIVGVIAVSDKAGHLDDVLETLAEFYTSEIDNALKTLISLLEPLLLFGIGFFIGFVALAVIVQIFQLTSQF